MDFTAILEAAKLMPLDEQIRLVDAIRENIAGEEADLELTEEFKKELERRWNAYKAAPETALPWEVVKARALARLRK
jgi:putative addiction module component (TIGR02574 family)